LSYNNHESIKEKFKDWNIVEVKTQYARRKAGNKNVIDLLIMNWKEIDGQIIKLNIKKNIINN
jgi:hypothetical protein